jgi:hypothetical protein
MSTCITYTKSQYEAIFGQLKNCFAESATSIAKERLYKIKCKEENLKELFLYVWALNDWNINNWNYVSEDNFLTEEEFANIITRVLSICNCGI